METVAPRRGFALKGLLAVVIILGLLSVIAFPAIQAAREAARRNQCSCKLKQMGLALQNYHDAFKKFPALTHQGNADGAANVWYTAPGATFAPNSPAPNGYTQSPASAAGYSWIVMVLPYLEEQVLYDQIARASEAFTYEAFTGSEATAKPNNDRFCILGCGPSRHFSTIALDEIACPSYAGNAISTASSRTAKPRVTIEPYARLFQGQSSPPFGVTVTNYVALSATHLDCMGLGPDDPRTETAEPPNGTIVPGKGLNMKAVLDGTSRTLIVCETKEPAVNSWYDGTVCWTVGANPNASSPPTVNASGYWSFPPGTTNAGGLDYGPGADGTPLFAPHGTTPAQTQPVSWGPSSDHSGSVVLHLACDAAVHALTADIDPALYLQLITRAGREPVVNCGDD
jgi:type II secretory pathway pseudopilin PulG